MPQIGWLEILAVVIIAILVLGPKEFPIALKNTFSSFQREISSVTSEIDSDKDITKDKDLKKKDNVDD